MGCRRFVSHAEMAEGDETVVGVFSVEIVVGPMAVETAVGGPERVYEIEAAFVDAAGDAAFETSERVQRCRGGKKVGNGRTGNSEESALGSGLGEEPIGYGGVYWKTEMRDERNGAGSCVEVADFLLRLIAPGGVGGLEAFQAADQIEDSGWF